MHDLGIKTWTETLPTPSTWSAFKVAATGAPCASNWAGLRKRPSPSMPADWVVEKNLPFLLQAFTRVPGACLAIVGDGPDLPALRQQAHELGVQERILFTGGASYPEMPDYYAAADFFCIPVWPRLRSSRWWCSRRWLRACRWWPSPLAAQRHRQSRPGWSAPPSGWTICARLLTPV